MSPIFGVLFKKYEITFFLYSSKMKDYGINLFKTRIYEVPRTKAMRLKKKFIFETKSLFTLALCNVSPLF